MLCNITNCNIFKYLCIVLIQSNILISFGVISRVVAFVSLFALHIIYIPMQITPRTKIVDWLETKWYRHIRSNMTCHYMTMCDNVNEKPYSVSYLHFHDICLTYSVRSHRCSRQNKVRTEITHSSRSVTTIGLGASYNV